MRNILIIDFLAGGFQPSGLVHHRRTPIRLLGHWTLFL